MAAPIPNSMFMLDIETTGIDPAHEEVLQIALVEMKFKDGKWEPGREFSLFQGTSRKPTTKFAQDHMKEIYERCNREPRLSSDEVRSRILQFCADCGSRPPNIFFAGWNAGIFDIPFLAHHGYIVPARYENDKLTGDCHYRVYEISGALQLAANVKGHNEINKLLKEAEKLGPKIEGTRHEAVFDCYRQIHLLNGLIQILKVE